MSGHINSAGCGKTKVSDKAKSARTLGRKQLIAFLFERMDGGVPEYVFSFSMSAKSSRFEVRLDGAGKWGGRAAATATKLGEIPERRSSSSATAYPIEPPRL